MKASEVGSELTRPAPPSLPPAMPDRQQRETTNGTIRETRMIISTRRRTSTTPGLGPSADP